VLAEIGEREDGQARSNVVGRFHALHGVSPDRAGRAVSARAEPGGLRR
jgi:hypothetical protein